MQKQYFSFTWLPPHARHYSGNLEQFSEADICTFIWWTWKLKPRDAGRPAQGSSNWQNRSGTPGRLRILCPAQLAHSALAGGSTKSAPTLHKWPGNVLDLHALSRQLTYHNTVFTKIQPNVRTQNSFAQECAKEFFPQDVPWKSSMIRKVRKCCLLSLPCLGDLKRTSADSKGSAIFKKSPFPSLKLRFPQFIWTTELFFYVCHLIHRAEPF